MATTSRPPPQPLSATGSRFSASSSTSASTDPCSPYISSFTDTPLTTPNTSSFIRSGGGRVIVDEDVIPSRVPGEPRNLVLCFDGTGDQFDNDNSNIVQLFSLLKKDDRHRQMVYYQAGIGTYTVPQVATPFWTNISKTVDMMIAWNLDAHVMGGYEFLMENYEAGDKICIFGFSRGAYTARALAGMIHKVGLLPACNHQQIPFAYKMYTKADEEGWEQSTAFKKAFCIDVEVEFLGVWDTVCSVGLIPRTLPFTTSNTAVKYFRHALSLDEHRAKFKHNCWNKPTEEQQKLGTQPGDMPKSNGQRSTKDEVHRNLERQYSHDYQRETDVLEVWFAGCHCDVGGGSVPNDTPHSLARIPLRWMIRQCFECKIGIAFHASQLRTIGLDPASLYPAVKERPPLGPEQSFLASAQALLQASKDSPLNGRSPFLSEEEEDILDALSPIYDQLVLAKGWWLLEMLPMEERYQNGEDGTEWLSVNLGRPRTIRRQKKDGLRVHRTVKLRMVAEELLQGGKYIPRAKFEVEPTWVD
ncbi:hypothetical protein GLOTRDRAFT_46622 [Gloeophyllum trabeum ATCC 11539]|uniref:T6SS Phospholipase effector Tle1-like catalytic domain-containing protein n=1 Tax=Gloeophyllum trabeum (strain ATCC 11539 / FP-39264 / Madison 617) TaxID=670483 RepID=S7REF2_GLOTA|nr:uncharacterized protein GLOTRDRAFT_46622 [Gloeophyllum trabeum ATCC 11539]EPQ52600.1 hypothetical protein GLOTRDRAFT_46622 [Gloeophyllum trabeum ATCC 11539]